MRSEASQQTLKSATPILSLEGALATLKHYLTIARAQPEQHAWFSQAEMLIRMLEGKVSSAVAPNSEPEPRALIEVPNSPTSKPSTASSLPSLPPGVLTPERRIALVIGNAAYPEQPLRNPRHDASDMLIALQEVGFVVSPVYDGDKRTMLEAIRAFRQQVRPGDVALEHALTLPRTSSMKRSLCSVCSIV